MIKTINKIRAYSAIAIVVLSMLLTQVYVATKKLEAGEVLNGFYQFIIDLKVAENLVGGSLLIAIIVFGISMGLLIFKKNIFKEEQ